MVEVSCIDTSAFTAEDYQTILSRLSPLRREKAERYRTRAAAYLSAGAGYLLDCALRRAGLAERDAKYAFGEHGKPMIGGFYFNLSHSGTVAVLATADGEVGVDIEKVVPVGDGLVARVCTKRERALFAGIPDGEFPREFFRLWTAKESVGKFLGTGLGGDPKGIEVNLTPPASATCRGKELRAALFEYAIEGYALTACADEPFDAQLNVLKFAR